MQCKSDENRIGTGIVPSSGKIEDARPIARVHHDSSYVAQLIAEAAGLPQMPRRRHLERRDAIGAYAAADALHRPGRIGRSA